LWDRSIICCISYSSNGRFFFIPLEGRNAVETEIYKQGFHILIKTV
jgi:hypothetical protein